MPIYEYNCNGCSETLEVIQKVSEKALLVCPRCGENNLKKKASLNSFQLKGSGWYRDGYGGNSQNSNSQPPSSASSSNGDKKSGTKSTAA